MILLFVIAAIEYRLIWQLSMSNNGTTDQCTRRHWWDESIFGSLKDLSLSINYNSQTSVQSESIRRQWFAIDRISSAAGDCRHTLVLMILWRIATANIIEFDAKRKARNNCDWSITHLNSTHARDGKIILLSNHTAPKQHSLYAVTLEYAMNVRYHCCCDAVNSWCVMTEVLVHRVYWLFVF